jgi:hypothetical protein
MIARGWSCWAGIAIFERDARGRTTMLTLRTKTNTLQAKRKK